MIGVVVPAHDEVSLIGHCLDALHRAACHPALGGEPVRVVVVLDACSDGTAEAVRATAMAGLTTIDVDLRNVGAARAAGADVLLAESARWLAFTDADSRVADDWLAAQLALGAEAVCGCVGVDDWSPFGHEVQLRHDANYRHADGHRHVHGANLGVAPVAYVRAGGFKPLRCGEDVQLVEDLQRAGADIAWSAAPRVLTSARRTARARGGFSDFLVSLERHAADMAECRSLRPAAL